MVNRGANPFVRYNGKSSFEDYNIDYLSNLPSQKSVYFITRPLHPDNVTAQNSFLGPWRYKTGVFDGTFISIIGKEAAATLISGYWFGKRAAYKFVPIGTQKYQADAHDRLKTLNQKLKKGSTIGSKTVSLFGHYR